MMDRMVWPSRRRGWPGGGADAGAQISSGEVFRARCGSSEGASSEADRSSQLRCSGVHTVASTLPFGPESLVCIP